MLESIMPSINKKNKKTGERGRGADSSKKNVAEYRNKNLRKKKPELFNALLTNLINRKECWSSDFQVQVK